MKIIVKIVRNVIRIFYTANFVALIGAFCYSAPSIYAQQYLQRGLWRIAIEDVVDIWLMIFGIIFFAISFLMLIILALEVGFKKVLKGDIRGCGCLELFPSKMRREISPFRKGISKGIKIFLTAFSVIIIGFKTVSISLPPTKPNIIVIGIDTLRADHLGVYGYGRNTSPAIDKFAHDSVLFKQCMSTAPSTTPSMASFFTSLIPSHHGASYAIRQPMAPHHVTFTELLKNNGYATISIAPGGQIGPEFGFGQGFDYVAHYPEKDPQRFKWIVTNAMNWLERLKKKQFFIFLYTYETHHPYLPLMEYLNMFEDGYRGDLPLFISEKLILEINAKRKTERISDDDLQHIINTYDAEIRSMDDSFKLLIDFLKQENLYNNTMIVFLSDHGEEFLEREVVAWHSHTLYDELLHVPLMIKFPQQQYRGTVVDEQISLLDVMPTASAYLGIDKPLSVRWEGRDRMALIKGDGVGDRYAVAQYECAQEMYLSGPAIRTDEWKLFGKKLFNLIDDPGERVDVSEENQEVAHQLRRVLYDRLYDAPNCVETKKIDLSKEQQEFLKSLGYAN